MPEIKLTADEADVLRLILASLTVKSRTGEIGVLHGMGRFVSAQCILKKAERIALDDAARKLGLAAGMTEYKG